MKGWQVLVFGIALGFGCSDVETQNKPAECAPGEVRNCTCDDGSTSSQTCFETAQEIRYSECGCTTGSNGDAGGDTASADTGQPGQDTGGSGQDTGETGDDTGSTQDTGGGADAGGDDAAVDMSAPSLTPPTGLNASDGTFENYVNLTWNPSSGAEGYRIFRDEQQVGSVPNATAFDDTGALRTLPTASGLNLTASQDLTDMVTVTWAEPTTRSVHEYYVIAYAGDEVSAPSARETGYRSVPDINSYDLQIGEGGWVSVGLVTEYEDTSAPAPIVVGGTVVASEDDYRHVSVGLSDHSSSAGDTVTYQVRAVSILGAGTASEAVSGARAAHPLSVQWWRSTDSGEFSDYEVIEGATGADYLDVDAPLDGEPRWYFAKVAGVEDSGSAQGRRTVITVPFNFNRVTISGDRMLFRYMSSGSSYLYEFNGESWVEGTAPADIYDVMDMSLEGDAISVVGWYPCDGGGTCTYWIRRYDWNNSESTWDESFSIEEANTSLHGGLTAVHANAFFFNRSTQVKGYRYNNDMSAWTSWSTLYLLADSLASGGDWVVVGDRSGNTGAGRVGVYTIDDGGTTTSIGPIAPAEAIAGDDYGDSVDTDGARVIVGAPNTGGVATGAGAAYIYVYDEFEDEWTYQILTASDPGEGDGFGEHVAISGDQLVVSAPGNNAVYLFRRTPMTEVWTEYQRIRLATLNSFGNLIEIDGPWIAVGWDWNERESFMFYSDY